MWYKVTHPLYGSEIMFESWGELCDTTVELAEQAIYDVVKQEICTLTEIMLRTAVEYAPETPDTLS